MRTSVILKLLLVLVAALPAVVVRLSGTDLAPLPTVAVFGAAVVASSFLLAWAAEVAQVDVSASLATALLALIAVLPEYAVDLYFAFTSGHDPAYASYAAANMTGSNRLLIGIGWPLVAVLFAVGARRRRSPQRPVTLAPGRRVEMAYLAAATVYAFVIPLKGTLGLVDAAVLLGLFVAYLVRTGQQEKTEVTLHGLPGELAVLPAASRRTLVVVMFLVAAGVILLAAQPFADGLVAGGKALGLDEFLLVQWLAPLASEAPELIVAGILALRGDDDAALGTLLSSKVNQWTLLVGSLPLAHLAGGGSFALALDARQIEEFFLTSAQAVLALAVLLDLRFGKASALFLFAAFASQIAVPSPSTRTIFAFVYLAVALLLFVRSWRAIGPTVRAIAKDATS